MGYLPTPALEFHINARQVVWGALEGQDAGYLVFRRRLSLPEPLDRVGYACIIQTAVHMDARRAAVGLSLLTAVHRDVAWAGSRIIQAWCRIDLESGRFWDAAGYCPTHRRSAPTARGQDVILWRKPLTAVRAAAMSAMPDISRFRHAPNMRVEALPMNASV